MRMAALGHYEERLWEPNLAGPGRRHRRAGTYRAFVPAPIAERPFPLDGDAVAALGEAARALNVLHSTPMRVAVLEAHARNLLRSEAVASSRIEGLAVSCRRLARVAHGQGHRAEGDRRAQEILANVTAMVKAVAIGSLPGPLTPDDIREIHRTLLRDTFDARIAGVVRTTQNWIGGSDYHPLDAPYVPPPPEYVEPLLTDLCAFMARDDVAPVVQAAIAHAQFETIHPFADGNGRVGRALIQSILRRRGETLRYVPPVSLILAGQPRSYVAGLVDYREGRVGEWIVLFAVALRRSAEAAIELSEKIEALEESWVVRLGSPRADAAARELLAILPAQPVLDVAVGQQYTGKSHVAVGAALRRLADAGILQPLNARKWGRSWECSELLQLIEQFEEGIAGAP